jgi:hypothetical protein
MESPVQLALRGTRVARDNQRIAFQADLVDITFAEK